MLVNVDFKAPSHCNDCKFLETGTKDFGRTMIFVCSITNIGDAYSEGFADKNRAEKRMREACHFI